jgi:hypothetical protein
VDAANARRPVHRGAGFDAPGGQVRSTNGGFRLFSIGERIELLAGRIEVVSARGSGARVALIAPLPRAPVAEEPEQAEARVEPSDRNPTQTGIERGRRIQILAVDDHKIVREGFVALIQNRTGPGSGGRGPRTAER